LLLFEIWIWLDGPQRFYRQAGIVWAARLRNAVINGCSMPDFDAAVTAHRAIPEALG